MIVHKHSEDGRNWFALYTKPRNEFKAAEQITSADVEYYLPTITRLKQWSDRKKKVTEPVLRGYIFIFATEKERLISLEQKAIVRCVTDMGRAAKIPEWQIENLMRVLDTKSEIMIKEGLVPGVKVRIKDGPFEDIIGTVQETDSGTTLSVSIDLLNRSVITRLPKDSTLEVVKNK